MCCALVWAVLAAAGEAPAQVAPQVRLQQVQTTFLFSARTGQWVQMIGTISNPTERDVLAEVHYKADDPQRGQVRFLRTVWVPARSVTRTCLTARPGHMPPRPGQSPNDPSLRTAAQSFELNDARSGLSLHRGNDIHLRPIDDRADHVAWLDDASPPGNFSDLLRASRTLHAPASSRVQFLPDRWCGWDCVDLLLIGRLTMDRVRSSQLQAMLDWVRAGGVVALFADEQTEAMLRSELGAAAGAVVAGSAWTKRVRVTHADGRQDEAVFHRPQRLLALEPDGAEVLAWADGAPLMTGRRLGSGMVFVIGLPPEAFLAQNPPAGPGGPAQPVLNELWDQVGLTLHAPPALSDRRFDEPARRTLRQISGRRGVGSWTVLAVLGGFALATTLAGMVLRFRGRGELTWVLMLPVALVLGAVLFHVARARANSPRVSFVALAVTQPDGRATVRQATAYYSPEPRTIALPCGSPLGTIFPLGEASARGLAQTLVVSDGGMTLPRVEIHRDSAPEFLTTAVVDLPGPVEADLAFGPRGLEGTITNRTNLPLTDAVLYLRRRAYAVGALPAGQPVRVALGPEQRMGEGAFVNRAVKLDEDLLREQLARQLTAQNSRDERAYLLAWSRQSPLPPGGDAAAPDADGHTLLVAPLALGGAAPGQRVLLTQEMIGTQYVSRGTTLWDPRSRKFIPFPRDAAIEVVLRPPPVLGALRDVRVTLHVHARAAGRTMTICGVTPQERLVEIASFNSPAQRRSVEIPDAGRFQTADGAVRIHIETHSPPPGDPQKQPPHWHFESIDATLEGTVP